MCFPLLVNMECIIHVNAPLYDASHDVTRPLRGQRSLKRTRWPSELRTVVAALTTASRETGNLRFYCVKTHSCTSRRMRWEKIWGFGAFFNRFARNPCFCLSFFFKGDEQRQSARFLIMLLNRCAGFSDRAMHPGRRWEKRWDVTRVRKEFEFKSL